MGNKANENTCSTLFLAWKYGKKNSIIGEAVVGKPVWDLGQLLESAMTGEIDILGPLKHGEQILEKLIFCKIYIYIWLRNRGRLSVERCKVVKIVIQNLKSYHPKGIQISNKLKLGWYRSSKKIRRGLKHCRVLVRLAKPVDLRNDPIDIIYGYKNILWVW